MQPDHLTTYWEKEEDENSKKGIIGSVCFHSFLLLILLLPWFKSIDPPPGPQGVVISLGNPTSVDPEEPSPAESTADLAYQNEASEPPQESPPASQEATKQVENRPEPLPIKQDPVKEVPAKFIKTVQNTQAESPVKIQEDKEKKEAILKEEIKRKNEVAKREAQAKAEAAKLKVKEELEAKRQAEAASRKKAEAEAKLKAEAQRKKVEEEARKKREEEQKNQEAYARTKSELGNLFDGNGDSSESQGKKGDPDGSSNSEILDGLAGGLGEIGGGLSGRGILYEPKIIENSQKTGKVVVKVCVDRSGTVISAKFTQRGSTTTDTELVDVAEKAAAKYKFTQGELAEQCGTITIDFKLE